MIDPLSPTSPGHAQAGRWQRLAEFVLSGPPANTPVALPALNQAFQALGVPTADQERLITALVSAVAQINERAQHGRPVFPLLVCLLVSPPLAAIDENVSVRAPLPSVPLLLTAPNGWGFFLVEHSGNEIPSPGAAVHYVIQLFLYREGKG